MDEETSQENNGATFLKNNDKIEENDTVCVHVNSSNQYSIVVKRGQTIHMKYGALRHEFLIGKSYGVPISATAGYIYVLRANPTLWTKTLPKRTQILYTPDIGTILLLLDIKPGSIVCETGTGSGSLTHAIATCVAPTGHVYSYDIDASRVNSVQNDIKAHGLTQNATIIERDVYAMGFDAVNCDAIFLDLPCPWPLIEKCKIAFNVESGGRIVNFSPCMEQVQRVAEELERHGFIEIQTMELVPQKMKAVEVPTEKYESVAGAKQIAMGLELETTSEFDEPILDLIPFPSMQPTHSGYLTSATFLPSS